MFFLFYGLATISSILFIFYDANAFMEYANGMYVTAAMMFCEICTANIAFRMEKIFEYIKNCERLVNKSKYRKSHLARLVGK